MGSKETHLLQGALNCSQFSAPNHYPCTWIFFFSTTQNATNLCSLGSISLAHLFINRFWVPSFTVLFKFDIINPEWESVSCLLALLVCYRKTFKFRVVPSVDSQKYCWDTALLFTKSLPLPGSWSICPMFYSKSWIIRRYSLAPQER